VRCPYASNCFQRTWGKKKKNQTTRGKRKENDKAKEWPNISTSKGGEGCAGFLYVLFAILLKI
jgi:hypothetical protein